MLADKPLDFENLHSLIRWTSQTLLTCVDHRIKKGKLVYKNFSPNKALVVTFDSMVKIL